MAIAFDAGSNAAASAVTSLTWSHTCTGSDLILMVGAYNHGVDTDICTGVTYNGISMTRVNTVNNAGGASTASRLYLYQLVAPATGAHDIVISMSSSTTICGSGASYTGVNQSSPIDTNNTGFTNNGTSISVSTTTTVDNSWWGGTFRTHGGTWTPDANSTQRVDGDASGIGYADDTSNPITPAGAAACGITGGTGDLLGCCASLKPSTTRSPSGGAAYGSPMMY